jgi:pimeloyl-ACP methyl ester carboxylesterase
VRFYRDGWRDDVRGWDWGFDPREIDGSNLLICYGGRDVYTPPQHGEWLAKNIPGATAIFFPEGTHREVQQYGVYSAIDWCLGKSVDLGKIDTHAVITT